MDLYVPGSAVAIRYPIGQTDAQHLAEELAARLDELVSGAANPFSGLVSAGIPTTDIEAIYVGTQADWAVPWWVSANDIGVKVVSGADCLNPACTGSELHIIARDYPLLLRAVWMTLHNLGWRHYMPNGVDGLEELWVYKNARTTIRTNTNRVWAGVVDHLKPNIAGGTSILTWSDGSNHLSGTHPNGLQEGDLAGAFGDVPAIESDPTGARAGAWLRHMGWTSSSSLQANAAWGFMIDYSADHGYNLSLWDASTGVGHYTDGNKLFTDNALVREVARAYANDESLGTEWVSLSRDDGDLNWDIDFGDAAFGAKLPVTRQIELANHVTNSPDYNGTGIVIQAYGRTAEQPDLTVMPDASAVCVIVMEAYRPAGKTIEDVIADYTDASGNAICPIGLYQYLHSSAWGLGDITAKAGNPQALVDAVNRVKFLPPVSPKVLTGEAMTEFCLYGFGYYCYMRMILDIGRVSANFTLSDFKHHANNFLTDMFPTPSVRTAIEHWYGLLLDREHKPLLSEHLLRGLWDELQVATDATTAGSDEEKRMMELGKFTRYLDLRNRYEAAEAAGLSSESAYDEMMELVFRIRDSGLVDTYGLFFSPLNAEHHAALGLDSIFGALNEPPGDNRGASANQSAWITTVPSVDDFKDPVTGWIAEGVANNSKHGLTETSFSTRLEAGSFTDTRARQPNIALRPYRAKDKMRIWLIPGAAAFECMYKRNGGEAYVEFINQATDKVDAAFVVNSSDYVQQNASLTAGQLYEIRLTTYGNDDRMWLDWWTDVTQRHHVSFDPGRDGDPCGFQTDRSFYFLIPAGVSAIHFYASKAAELQLFYLDSQGDEQKDLAFTPVSRAYQSHSVGGSGRRVARIAGIQQNDPGFWLLNCPNLFALHPEELLKPEDA
jgi:hypothetical protein